MTHDLPRNDADNGEPVVAADQRNWGPGGPRPRSALVEPWTPSSSVGWRAYHKAMFPPGGLVTPWIRFKVMSTGVTQIVVPSIGVGPPLTNNRERNAMRRSRAASATRSSV
jgi:hypothetical protein